MAHGPKSTRSGFRRSAGTIDAMPDRDPGEVLPRRLLERAPSERFGAGGPTAAGGGESGGLLKAALLGLGAATIGSAIHVACAVLLLATGGLLVVAATLGFVVGVIVRYGAGSRVGSGARRLLGVSLALAALAAALAVNWGLSGAYLGPLDFLDQVYGLLVPLQFVAAAAGVITGAR
jgi:hypothetical protein